MKGIKIIERILLAIPIMLGVAVFVFTFMRLTPGDPVDLMMGEAGNVSEEEVQALKSEFHLDKPLPVQLGIFLSRLFHGDLGNSFKERKPVWDMIMERLPATVELALGSLLFALIIAIPIGVISAVRQNSLIDRAGMTFAFLGISMPAFWLAIVLIIIFSCKLGFLPVFGRSAYKLTPTHITGMYVLDSILSYNLPALKDSIKHLILPSISLGAAVAAIITRILRSSMLEVLRTDYIILARTKGLSEYVVITKHALRNALIPTVTVLGIQVGVLLGGNMIIETIFGWPGIGRMVVTAIFNRDFPVVQGAVMFYAFIYVAANLIVDILYTYLNPKTSL